MIWIYYAFFDPDSGENKRETEHKQGMQLLWKALEERYGIKRNSRSEPEIVKGTHGKPYLKEYPDIYFNISHCRGLAAAAVGSSPMGIDVERVRPFRESLLGRVLSKEEQRQMEAAEEGKRAELFFRFWTLKESYVKAVGCGITMPLKEISFQYRMNGEAVCNKPEWKFRQWDMAKDCILSVCAMGEEEIRLAEQEEQA